MGAFKQLVRAWAAWDVCQSLDAPNVNDQVCNYQLAVAYSMAKQNEQGGAGRLQTTVLMGCMDLNLTPTS